MSAMAVSGVASPGRLRWLAFFRRKGGAVLRGKEGIKSSCDPFQSRGKGEKKNPESSKGDGKGGERL